MEKLNSLEVNEKGEYRVKQHFTLSIILSRVNHVFSQIPKTVRTKKKKRKRKFFFEKRRTRMFKTIHSI